MKRILIVDDHADIRRLVRMTLEFESYEVHEAADGEEALAKARELCPDAVLLDVMMPGELDGLQVCAAIKADARLAATHVMLLSARGQARDREEGLRAGAEAYLVKPFSPLQLIDNIAHALSAPN
jgi:CheY-like chemotaxis protein